MQINSYLTFSGNCREAMTFYKECLGGELNFQTIGESPLADKMPPQMKECILHSTLTKGSLVLQGSDMIPQSGLIKGNSVSLSLNCSSEEEIKICYTKLSTDGEETHPIEDTFWGAMFGDLTDKYGNHWLLNFDKNSNHNNKKQFQKEISEAFAYGKVNLIMEYLADNIRWNILGEPPITGKAQVIELLKMSQLESFPVVTINNIICESDFVIIESKGVAKTKKGNQYNQTYCDVFNFKLGKLQEVTTYLDTAMNKEIF